MAAGGGPCIPLASRILKDRSKPWQETARARIPTCFMAESRIFRKIHECSMIEATEDFLQTAGSVGYPLSTYRYSGNAIFFGLGDLGAEG